MLDCHYDLHNGMQGFANICNRNVLVPSSFSFPTITISPSEDPVLENYSCKSEDLKDYTGTVVCRPFFVDLLPIRKLIENVDTIDQCLNTP